MSTGELAQEWLLLQNQFDSYEKYSLVIKLLNVALVGFTLITVAPVAMVLFLVAILWVQDAIWKTFQSRIEVRLLTVESLLAGDDEIAARDTGKAFQFNRQFAENRPGSVALIMEYARQAIKPTVAYPHALLLLLLGCGILAS